MFWIIVGAILFVTIVVPIAISVIGGLLEVTDGAWWVWVLIILVILIVIF